MSKLTTEDIIEHCAMMADKEEQYAALLSNKNAVIHHQGRAAAYYDMIKVLAPEVEDGS